MAIKKITCLLELKHVNPNVRGFKWKGYDSSGNQRLEVIFWPDTDSTITVETSIVTGRIEFYLDMIEAPAFEFYGYS